MNIIIKKDGNLSVNESPLQGKEANLDNLAAFISNPNDGDAIVYNAEKGIWEAGEVSGGGSGGGGLIVKITESEGSLVMDHTWKEIYDAFPVMPVSIFYDGEVYSQGHIATLSSSDGTYVANAVLWMSDAYSASEFTTDNENGYPSVTL